MAYCGCEQSGWTMSTNQTGRGERYEIVVGRRLGARSAAAFDGFELIETPGEGTLLRSSTLDQAALFGVLGRIRDLGIPLVSVRLMTGGTSSDETE
jgi:hypothetical protein